MTGAASAACVQAGTAAEEYGHRTDRHVPVPAVTQPRQKRGCRAEPGLGRGRRCPRRIRRLLPLPRPAAPAAAAAGCAQDHGEAGRAGLAPALPQNQGHRTDRSVPRVATAVLLYRD